MPAIIVNAFSEHPSQDALGGFGMGGYYKRIKNAVTVSSVLVTLAVLGNVPALDAQAVSNASVTGRVLDEQGALVAGAQIKMAGVDTGAVYNAVTNSDGIYNIPSLPIGAYTLESTVAGFQTYVQSGISLRVNDAVQINVTM